MGGNANNKQARDRCVHPTGNVHWVVVADSVDGHEREAGDVACKYVPTRQEFTDTRMIRRLQLEHHDGDDDCNHTIAEGFEACGPHACSNFMLSERTGCHSLAPTSRHAGHCQRCASPLIEERMVRDRQGR